MAEGKSFLDMHQDFVLKLKFVGDGGKYFSLGADGSLCFFAGLFGCGRVRENFNGSHHSSMFIQLKMSPRSEG